MHRLLFIAALFCVSAPAFGSTVTPKRCGLIGTWGESVYGGTITLTTNKVGTALVPQICSQPYNVTVTAWGVPGFDVHGGIKGKVCPAWFAALKFEPGSCTVAKGTLYRNTGKLPDTWTKTSKVASRPASHVAALTTGLK